GSSRPASSARSLPGSRRDRPSMSSAARHPIPPSSSPAPPESWFYLAARSPCAQTPNGLAPHRRDGTQELTAPLADAQSRACPLTRRELSGTLQALLSSADVDAN